MVAILADNADDVTHYYWIRLGENWIPAEPATDAGPETAAQTWYIPGSDDPLPADAVGPQLLPTGAA
jgi:hypothetical protein